MSTSQHLQHQQVMDAQVKINIKIKNETENKLMQKTITPQTHKYTTNVPSKPNLKIPIKSKSNIFLTTSLQSSSTHPPLSPW